MYTSVCVTLKKNIASTLSLLTLDAEVGYVADIGHVKDVGHVALLREAPVSLCGKRVKGVQLLLNKERDRTISLSPPFDCKELCDLATFQQQKRPLQYYHASSKYNSI